MQLNNEEIRRYSRHLILPEVGLAGQKKIKATSVLCIGAGGAQGGKAVHMMSIHAEVGMQCADCHFAQDGHGNGFIHGEVANASAR